MKRILPLVILVMIAEITFTVWLGIVIFEEKTVTLPKEAVVVRSSEDICHDQIKVIINNKTKTYIVEKSQFQRITKEGKFSYYFGYTFFGPMCIILYVAFVFGVICHIFQWIECLVECSPHPVNSGKHTNWRTCCNSRLCNARCNLYNRINEIDTTPAKQQFKSFWGY